MIRRSSLWIGSVLLLTSLTGYAGGPPILTTSKVPDYFVVGRPETLVFVVRAFRCGHPPFVRKDYRVPRPPSRRDAEIYNCVEAAASFVSRADGPEVLLRLPRAASCESIQRQGWDQNAEPESW
jgi:hypothetical protein